MLKSFSTGSYFILLLINLFFCDQVIFGQNLIARYEFNNSAIDISGFRNHGQVKGNVTGVPDRFGNPCSAYLFDGNSGYIEVPSSPSLESPSTKVAFTFWYKLSNDLSPVKWLTILCKGGSSSENISSPQYRLQVYQNRESILNTCNPVFPSPGGTVSINTEFTICDEMVTNHFLPVESWHFYAVTYDGSFVRSYMDGQKIFEKAYNGVLQANQESLFIGKDIPGNTEFYNGAMDDLRIYDGPLSDLQVMNIYKEKKLFSNIEDDPYIQFPQDLNLDTDPGRCSAIARFLPPVFSKQCLSYTISQIEGPLSGSSFPVGRTRIKYKISSSLSSIQFVTFHVNVMDKELPVIAPLSDSIILLNTTDTAISYMYPMATATDNCALKSIKQTSGKPSGSLFEPGDHIFSFVAEDKSGNMSYASFKLTVIKNLSAPPLIDTPIVSSPQKDTIVIPIDTLSTDIYKKLNLVVLIDISASMKEGNKFDLLKTALQKLVSSIRRDDQLTIMTFSDRPVIIHNTSNDNNRDQLIKLIDGLKASGGTNIEEGLDFAYKLMDKVHIKEASNQMLLFTDGSFDLSAKQKKKIRSASEDDNQKVNLAIFNILREGEVIPGLKELAEKTGGDYLPITKKDEAVNNTMKFVKSKSLK